MAEGSYEHVVIGSTPLAGLLAGLLTQVHQRRVALIGAPFSPFRLQRSIDASADLYTRPETLRLVARAATETAQLVQSLGGKGLMTRVDTLLVAESPRSMAALGHFRHLAAALGQNVEPVADQSIATGVIVRIRGVQLLNHGLIEPALEAWLARLDVRHLDPVDTTLSLKRDGGARFTHNGHTFEAAQVILADDTAIIAHLPEEAQEGRVLVPARLMLVEPGRPLAAPLMHFLDRGVTLSQEGRAAAVGAIVAGDPTTARARLAASLPRATPANLAGEAMYTLVRTGDGGPFIGAARNTKTFVIAGLGSSGAFLAPALARFIAGKAGADEAAWLSARGTVRGPARRAVAEYAPVTA